MPKSKKPRKLHRRLSFADGLRQASALSRHNYPIDSRDLYRKEYRMTCENANAISGPGAKEISKAIKLFVSGYGEEALAAIDKAIDEQESEK